MKPGLLFFTFLYLFFTNQNGSDIENEPSLDKQQQLHHFPTPTIIAHRGTTFWAPEETEAAMRWARNTGVHYLEFDLQRTMDGYLIALHDNSLERCTDVAEKFPDRKNQPVSSFTYEELLTLDAGSWFNRTYPSRARTSFAGLDILTLHDILEIAEGKRIQRDINGKRLLTKTSSGRLETHYEPDPADNGNRPGIYPETKLPALFPGIEENLRAELEHDGWYHIDPSRLKYIATQPKKIGVANTMERVILQTFSKESLAKLQTTFVRPIPTCYLLWRGSDPDDLPNDDSTTFKQFLQYGKSHGARIIGLSIGGEPNNYPNLVHPELVKLIKKESLYLHAYSVDTPEQLKTYASYCDGLFCNKAEDVVAYYGKKKKSALPSTQAKQTLEKLGYTK